MLIEQVATGSIQMTPAPSGDPLPHLDEIAGEVLEMLLISSTVRVLLVYYLVHMFIFVSFGPAVLMYF